MISSTQILLARTMLNMSQREVSDALGWAHQTLSKIEKGSVDPPASRIKKLQNFYELAGVKFTEGDGVKRRQSLEQTILTGDSGVRSFFNDVYQTSKDTRKNIYIFNGLPTELIEAVSYDWYQDHAARMKLLDINVKTIVKEGEDNLIGHVFSKYKWFPADQFRNKMIYVYGNKFALISFDEGAFIKVINAPDISESLGLLIDVAWEKAQDFP